MSFIKMKKYILMLILSVFGIIIFTSCSNLIFENNNQEHTHDYEKEVIAPTCEEKGYDLYTCSCGDTYNDNYVDELTHSYKESFTWEGDKAKLILTCSNNSEHVVSVDADVTINQTNPTCTEDGIVTYIATATYDKTEYIDEKSDVLQAINHDYVVTFTWNGYEEAFVTITCKNDSSHKATLLANIEEESIGDVCVESAVITYKASVTYEGIAYEDTKIVETEVLGHSYEITNVVSPTCKEKGYTEYKCSRCDEKKIDDYTDAVATNHNYEYGICEYCDDIDEYAFNSTYGYDMLKTRTNATDLQNYYNELDEVYKKYHQNYVDITDQYRMLDFTFYGLYNLTYDEAAYVWATYRSDHPLYYWNSYNLRYYSSLEAIRPTMYEEFKTGSVRKQYDCLFIEFIRNTFDDFSENDSIYEKVLYFYETIINRVEYKYDENGEADAGGHAHSIAGVLDKTGAVCEGYAFMLTLLSNVSKIESIYTTGQDHAYNMIKLDDGNWYWFDPTWSDNSSWQLGVDYRYFAVNDTQQIGNWGYNWAVKNLTFIENHGPDEYETMNIETSYQLPERSGVIFDDENILEIYESFTIDSFTYTLIGYRQVMLSSSKATGDVVIPESVSYNGKEYKVVAVGGMKGGFPYSLQVFAYQTTTVTMPSTIKFIFDNAFDCSTLEEINVDENNSYYTDIDGVLFTKNLYTLIKFPSAHSATTYYVPDEVNDIAKNAFYVIKNIQTLYIGSNVKYIGTYHYSYGYRDNDGDKLMYKTDEEGNLSLYIQNIIKESQQIN